MVPRSKPTPTPLRIVRSLPFAAALIVALAGAVLIPERAWSADLRLQKKPVEQQETALARRQRLFEEFLRHLQKKNQ